MGYVKQCLQYFDATFAVMLTCFKIRKRDPLFPSMLYTLNSEWTSWGVVCVSLNDDKLLRAHQSNTTRQVRRVSFARR